MGLVIRVSDKWWGAAVPLETWVDNTTAELLGVVLGRCLVERLRDLGARTIEQTYDAQAAAALAEKPPEQQKHPLRRALPWSVGEAAATHWWVKSHQEVSALTSHNHVRKMGNILADAQAREAVDKSAKGQRLAVPLPLSATYGGRPTAQGSVDMEWRIHAPSKWRPPRALHPWMEQLLRESPEMGIVLVPLHLGMWHPRLKACLRCERHEEVTTRYRCPCHRAKWRRALQVVSPPWRLHGGLTLCISTGGPFVTHVYSRGRRRHAQLGRSPSRPCARASGIAGGAVPPVGLHSTVLRP